MSYKCLFLIILFQTFYHRSGQSLHLPSPGGAVAKHCPILPDQAPAAGTSNIRSCFPLALLCDYECFGGNVSYLDDFVRLIIAFTLHFCMENYAFLKTAQ